MYPLFKYNWAVRDEWFERCRDVPHEELIRERVGGLGSILKTLFHIVDVEYSWIQAMRGLEDAEPRYEDYQKLSLIEELSQSARNDIRPFLASWSSDFDLKEIEVPWMKGKFYGGEVLRHVIVHEIHHMGQLSVWAKETGIRPAEAAFIERGFMNHDLLNERLRHRNESTLLE